MSLQIDKEEGFQGKVGHETHRKRGLFNPRIASLVLKHVPEYVPSPRNPRKLMIMKDIQAEGNGGCFPLGGGLRETAEPRGRSE